MKKTENPCYCHTLLRYCPRHKMQAEITPEGIKRVKWQDPIKKWPIKKRVRYWWMYTRCDHILRVKYKLWKAAPWLFKDPCKQDEPDEDEEDDEE